MSIVTLSEPECLGAYPGSQGVAQKVNAIAIHEMSSI
jgi:hypothetical protein